MRYFPDAESHQNSCILYEEARVYRPEHLWSEPASGQLYAKESTPTLILIKIITFSSGYLIAGD